MLKASLDSLLERDIVEAKKVLTLDDEVDALIPQSEFLGFRHCSAVSQSPRLRQNGGNFPYKVIVQRHTKLDLFSKDGRHWKAERR